MEIISKYTPVNMLPVMQNILDVEICPFHVEIKIRIYLALMMIGQSPKEPSQCRSFLSIRESDPCFGRLPKEYLCMMLSKKVNFLIITTYEIVHAIAFSDVHQRSSDSHPRSNEVGVNAFPARCSCSICLEAKRNWHLCSVAKIRTGTLTTLFDIFRIIA